jgi:hypothetical protein
VICLLPLNSSVQFVSSETVRRRNVSSTSPYCQGDLLVDMVSAICSVSLPGAQHSGCSVLADKANSVDLVGNEIGTPRQVGAGRDSLSPSSSGTILSQQRFGVREEA